MMTESVTISQTDLRKILSAANPDGALLYLYLQSGKPLETAEKELNMNGSRISCAAAILRQLGLLTDQRPTHIAPGERPAYTDEDVYKNISYIDPQTGEPLQRDPERDRADKREFRTSKNNNKGNLWKRFMDVKNKHKSAGAEKTEEVSDNTEE